MSSPALKDVVPQEHVSLQKVVLALVLHLYSSILGLEGEDEGDKRSVSLPCGAERG